MPLTEEQRERVKAWLQERRAFVACPSCGKNSWSLGEIVAAPIFVSGGIAIGGPTIPMVQLICDNCAYVRLHAAVPIGLLK